MLYFIVDTLDEQFSLARGRIFPVCLHFGLQLAILVFRDLEKRHLLLPPIWIDIGKKTIHINQDFASDS